MASKTSKKIARSRQKRKTTHARQQSTPRDEKSLKDELTVVHTRIQSMIARYLNEDNLSEEEWDDFWKLVDRKVALIEAELKHELSEQNVNLEAAIENLSNILLGVMSSE